MTDCLKRGAFEDCETLLKSHPEHEGELRGLLPAIQVLANLSHSKPPNDFPPDSEPSFGLLGDFQLIREVGRGGMGVVYEAEQISLARRVALKVLPFASTMDARQLQRFQNEVRAAASLQHPHIVPVYAVGCERGVHFYAMQFIEGFSLDAAIRWLKEEDGDKSKEIGSTSEQVKSETEEVEDKCAHAAETKRLGLFTLRSTVQSNRNRFHRVAQWGIQAAKALEHAHSMGMVHRDVKPANLLLNAQGQLWVTDFGLARTATHPGLTMTGDVVGTLRYMSPEQALAKHGLVDHRTDIYALGATLYELLTLRPAVQGHDREEILKNLALAEPINPRILNSAIPTALETIVLKAMAKDPSDRYASSQELADDLERFGKDEPIRARRPPLKKRLGQWCRRHKSAVWLGAAITLLTIMGLAAATILIWREKERTENALNEALAQQIKTKEQRRRANLNLNMALNSMTDMLYRLDGKDLADIHQIAQIRRNQSQHVLSSYLRLVDKNNQDAESRFEAARAYLSLGTLYHLLKDRAKAKHAREKAVVLSQALTEEFPFDPDYWLQLGHSHDLLAEEFEISGLEAQATDEYRQAAHAFSQAMRLAPNDHRGPNNVAWVLLIRPDNALHDPLEAIELAQRAVALAPDSAECLNTLGMANFRSGRWEAALVSFEKAIIVRSKTSLEPDCYYLFQLAMVHQKLGHPQGAQLWFRRACDIMDLHYPNEYQISRIRTEAAALLGVKVNKDR